MDLQDLSLDEFEALRLRMDVIRNAAQLLRHNGETPRICIAPGKPASITLPPLLGGGGASLGEVIHSWERKWFAPGDAVYQGSDFGLDFDPSAGTVGEQPAEAAPEAEASPDFAVLDGADVFPAPGIFFFRREAAWPDPAPADGVTDNTQALQGATPAADLAPAPLARPDAWRDDEVAKAIELGVAAVRAGQSVWSAAEALAAETGRTLAACQKRMKIVRGEVEAILAASDVPVAPPVETVTETTIPADMPAAEDPAPCPAEVVKAMIAEVAAEAAGSVQSDLPMDDLARHLNAHVAKGSWTLAQDTELFELAEIAWPIHEIALQLQKPVDDVKKRFDLLTDKKGARFKRADVLARIKRMQPPEQA